MLNETVTNLSFIFNSSSIQNIVVNRTISDIDVIRDFCLQIDFRFIFLWGAALTVVFCKMFIKRAIKKKNITEGYYIDFAAMFDDMADVMVVALCIINILLVLWK